MGKSGGLSQARTDVLEGRAQRNGMPLPPERQVEILKEANGQRTIRELGARTSNLAASKDASVTVSRIESEVCLYTHVSTE